MWDWGVMSVGVWGYVRLMYDECVGSRLCEPEVWWVWGVGGYVRLRCDECGGWRVCDTEVWWVWGLEAMWEWGVISVAVEAMSDWYVMSVGVGGYVRLRCDKCETEVWWVGSRVSVRLRCNECGVAGYLRPSCAGWVRGYVRLRCDEYGECWLVGDGSG